MHGKYLMKLCFLSGNKLKIKLKSRLKLEEKFNQLLTVCEYKTREIKKYRDTGGVSPGAMEIYGKYTGLVKRTEGQPGINSFIYILYTIRTKILCRFRKSIASKLNLWGIFSISENLQTTF